MTTESTQWTGGDVIRRRALAYLADAVALAGAVLLSGTGRGGSTSHSRPRRLASIGGTLAVVGTIYHVVLEGTWGQTLGKRLFGITVVRVDGGPCGYRAAAIRTAFRAVDALPVGYLAAFVAMAVTERRQRLGDLAAGTVVIRDESRAAELDRERADGGD